MAPPPSIRASPMPAHAGFFLLRTATLPIDCLEACSAAPAERLASDERGDPAPDIDEALQAWAGDPLADAAIYLASPSLRQRLADWRAAPTAAAFDALRPALFRYFVRMCTRATPFGLFAATSLGHAGRAGLVVGGREHLHRHSWLDLGFVHPLVRRASADPQARAALDFVVNSSLVATQDGWRYAEEKRMGKESRRELVRLDASDALDAVLAAARRPQCLATLAGAILSQVPEASHEEVHAFLHALIDDQVLVPALAPALTGPDPVRHVIERSRAIPALAALRADLGGAVQRLEQIDRDALPQARAGYHALAQVLLGLVDDTKEGQLFHVDLRRDAPDLGLPEALLARLARGVEALRRIAIPDDSAPMRQFCERFTERFGDRTVPLMDALDEDMGIGFEIDPANRRNEGLLAEFVFARKSQGIRRTPGSDVARHLADRLETAWSTGQAQITLDDADIDKLAVADPAPLPPLFTAFGCLAPARTLGRDEAQGDGFVLQMVDAGLGMFGRFCRADRELEARVRALLRGEEQLRPDVVFAEIVHLPDDRLGNIVCRPVLRTKEIVYQGESGMDRADQITVADLTIAVAGGRVVLRSRALGREVVPRLTCAHNHSAPNASPYRFLAALAKHDAGPAPYFSWGPFAGARFLPRVVYEGVVLAAASWRIDRSDCADWKKLPSGERLQRLGQLRLQRGIPRWVRAGYYDNLLTLDLENPLCADALLDEIAAGRTDRVIELIPAPQDFPLRSPEGRHAHELMVPFLLRSAMPVVAAATATPDESRHRRRFVPGSPWLYAKLYGSLHLTERALVSDIAPLMERLRAGGHIDRWHFVRYRDTDDHLRLRLHAPTAAMRREAALLVEQCFERWSRGNGIWRCQFDTYERETTRYGGPAAIEIAEEIFFADSDAVVALLAAAPADAGPHWRWQLALRILDLYMEAFGLELAAREQLARAAAAGFREEFAVTDAFERRLAERYRSDRTLIDALLAGDGPLPGTLPWASSTVERLRGQLLPLGARYRFLEQAGQLSVPLVDIIGSITHMHVNRLMPSNPREHEMILHAFLQRALRSRIARSGAAAP